jgi:hypothetical protein
MKLVEAAIWKISNAIKVKDHVIIHDKLLYYKAQSRPTELPSPNTHFLLIKLKEFVIKIFVDIYILLTFAQPFYLRKKKVVYS